MTLTFATPPIASALVVVTTEDKRKRCACGQPATHLCDWKTPPKRPDLSKQTGTCDAPLCTKCAAAAGDDKHLCPSHASDWFMRRVTAACFKCGEGPTPHIFKGVRYCPTCHPDPGPHIRRTT